MAPSTAAGASVARGYFAIIDKAPRHTLQMVSSSPISPRILANEQRDGKGDRRTHRRGQAAQTLFTQVPGETVWKIAEGVSPRLSGSKRRPNRDSFDPSWLLSEPRFGTYPEFPNSFGRRILGSSHPGSCVDRPPRTASPHLPLTLDDDASPHIGMYLAVVLVRPSRCLEGVRIALSRPQTSGVERSVVRRHGVRGAVLVDPSDPRPPLDGDVGRLEAEALDHYRPRCLFLRPRCLFLCPRNRAKDQHGP